MTVANRRQIDELHGIKTEPWVVGWTRDPVLFLLDRKFFETESNHKYSDEEYSALIKHELSHLFFGKIVGKRYYSPAWFSEGVAICSSGQLELKKRPTEFRSFLDFTEKGGSGVYGESGFVIELLLHQNNGKEKLLRLINSLKQMRTNDEFIAKFNELFSIELSYKNVNKLFNNNR